MEVMHTLIINMAGCIINRWLWNLNEYGLCVINNVPTISGTVEQVMYFASTEGLLGGIHILSRCKACFFQPENLVQLLLILYTLLHEVTHHYM